MRDVDTSTVFYIVLLLVPFIAGMAVYGMLRNRERGAFGAGCAAIVVGVFVSFALTGLFTLLTLS